MSSQYPIGKTIIELKMTTTNGLPFGNGASVVLTNPWTIQTILVPQNHVATICDGGDDYRFGFNGQEKVNEIAGIGNHYDMGLRDYSPQIARMWKIDPRAAEYPWQTTYAYHRNSPIHWIDYLGGGDPSTDVTKNPVVNYSPKAFMGLRLGTIPAEDSIYNLLMLLIVTSVYQFINEGHKKTAK